MISLVKVSRGFPNESDFVFLKISQDSKFPNCQTVEESCPLPPPCPTCPLEACPDPEPCPIVVWSLDIGSFVSGIALILVSASILFCANQLRKRGYNLPCPCCCPV
jgi:hypothetical protein